MNCLVGMDLFVAVVLAVLVLAGCAAPIRPALNDRFPDYCDVTQPDRDGQGGYTRGQFPCKLSHHEGGKP